jgi:hypothetical protein
MKKVSKFVLFSMGLMLAGSVFAGDLKVKFNVTSGAERAWEAGKGKLLLKVYGEAKGFKKAGYAPYREQLVSKEVESFNLNETGTYQLVWEFNRNQGKLSEFTYNAETDSILDGAGSPLSEIEVPYTGEGVSVVTYAPIRHAETQVSTVKDVALTAAQLKQKELEESRAKGGAAARVAAEAALKKAQEDQAREEAEAQQRELESQLERQKAAEKERAAQLKAEEERAAAEEQVRKDRAAEDARVNNAATRIQSKVRQRAATKQVDDMREEKARQVEEKRKEDERLAAEAEATRIAELKAHAEKEKADADARAAAEASSVTMGAGVGAGAGAGSGSSHATYIQPLLLEFESEELISKLEEKTLSGTVSFKTVDGNDQTLLLNEYTVFLNDIDRKQSISVTIEGYGSQSITVDPKAYELKVSSVDGALRLRGIQVGGH